MNKALRRGRAKTIGANCGSPTFKQNISSQNTVYQTQTFIAVTDNNTLIPPNCSGAVNANYVVSFTNQTFMVQNRLGATLFSESFSTFWSNGGLSFTEVSDANVYYDEFSERFIFVCSADPTYKTSRIFLAVSQTDSPLSGYYFFEQTADSTQENFFDFPRVGFNSQWIAISGNMYEISTENYNYSVLWIVNKADCYVGTLTSTYMGTISDNIPFTLVPASTRDASISTLYCVDNSYALNAVRISTITGNVNTPIFNLQTAISNPANVSWNDNYVDIPYGFQLGNSNNIGTIDDRMISVQYRNGYLWTGCATFFPSSSPTFASIMFLQMDPGTGTLTQQQFLGDGGLNGNTVSYGFPSVAINANSDILIGFNMFTTQLYAGAYYMFQSGSDSSKTFQTPVEFQTGLGSYYKTYGGGRNRWGDFSSAVVDPVNHLDFWAYQEFAAKPTTESEWGTAWCYITFQPGPTPTPVTSVTHVPSTNDKLSIGAIIGIVVSVVVITVIMIFVAYYASHRAAFHQQQKTKIRYS